MSYSYEKFLEKQESMKRLIRQENTGPASELAQKLGISRRTLFNYLRLLKNGDCQIKYCRCRKTYYFCCNDD